MAIFRSRCSQTQTNALDSQVPTLVHKPEFLSEAEEARLLQWFLTGLAPGRENAGTIRRAVWRFGSSVPYASYMRSSQIPAPFKDIIDRLMAENICPADHRPDSVTINEYQPKQLIAPHIDHVDSGKVITVISLGSPALMLFENGSSPSSNALYLELAPRCLTQISDSLRYDWKHSIAPVSQTRYSLVFRCSTVGA